MAELKSNVDQSLIDLAVKNGYTEEQARAYYGKNPTATSSNASPVQTGDSPATDWALQQGKKQIENQPAALAALKEPDVPAAAAQLVPAAANTLNANASGLFHGLDFSGEASGALEAAGAYGLYKTLKDKVMGGNTPPPPPPPPPVVTSAPIATPETPAPSGMAKLQERFNLVPKKELTPDETRQQKLKIAAVNAQQNMSPIEGAAAPISGQGATPLIPASPAPTDTPPITPPAAPPAPPPPPVPPSASPEPTPESAIVNNTMGASPVDKANALVNAPEAAPAETTPPAETPKATSVKGAAVPRAERGSLAGIANNPPLVEGQPGMREQYNIPKGANPATGERWMGPGGFNYLTGQLGPDAQQAWEEQYGKRNVPAKQVIADYAATRYPPTAVTAERKSGGAFETPKYIPEYIKGAATPAALATTAVASALPALGIAAYQKYKGNEAAVDASLQDAKESLKSLVTMPYDVSKAALKGDFGPLKDLMMSMNPGSLLFNEMNKKDEQIIKNMIQKEKVGAGRGVAPPSSYNR